jgi:hypothetical protein
MITIKFGRYVPTLNTININGLEFNIFKSIVDHNLNQSSELLSLERAVRVASHWLENHFGFVIIYLENTNEEDKNHYIRFCNYKKFVKSLNKDNIKVKLENHIKE